MNLRIHHCAHGVHYKSTNLLSIYANMIHIKCTARALFKSSGSLYHKLKKVLKIGNMPTAKSVYSFALKVRKKAKFRIDTINQVSHLSQDTIWKSDKSTRKCRIQESQEVSPFPAGDHKLQQSTGIVKSTYL